MASALCGDEGGETRLGDDSNHLFYQERQMATPSLEFVIPAFAGKLTARVTKESRKQMTKGLLLIRMYEGS